MPINAAGRGLSRTAPLSLSMKLTPSDWAAPRAFEYRLM